MDEFLFLVSPMGAVILAAILIHSGLRRTRKNTWLFISLGVIILLLICYWLFYLASGGYPGWLGAFFVWIVCMGIAIVCGIWMAWTLEKWRKVGALVVSVVFPMAMFFSVQMGDTQSPEEITKQNADEIVAALFQYQEKYGHFPSELSKLKPEYFATLPEALTSQHTGWLYQTKDDKFTFAYWKWPEKYGSWVCLYDVTNLTWNCELNNWGPFKPVPTPWPCKNEDGIWVDTADCK